MLLYAISGKIMILTCLNLLIWAIQILQIVAGSMKSLGSFGMFYLAAAVSDFYVPWESMV